MKVVYKYATGQEIPGGAKYLCTQVETVKAMSEVYEGEVTKNLFVWHYYEVEIEDKE